MRERVAVGVASWAAFVAVFAFSVMAWGQDLWPGLSSPPQVQGSGDGDVAVIVGIERYLLLPDVDGAVRNVNDWEAFFSRGLGIDEVRVLTNNNATKEGMLRVAEEAAAAAGDGGTVWYVFIGHGAPTRDGAGGALVGVDAQQSVESLFSRSLPQAELLEVLESGAQAQTVVVVDACFSGRDGGGDALAPGVQPVVPVELVPSMAATTVVLSAAQATEFAGALPGEARPAFSYLLLGALRGWAAGDDGEVTTTAAMRYVARQLRHLQDRQQTPEWFGPGDLVLVRGATEEDPIGDLWVRMAAREEGRSAPVERPGPSSSGEWSGARRAFDRQRLWTDGSYFYQGVLDPGQSQRTLRLDWPGFYETVDRADLAVEYRESEATFQLAVQEHQDAVLRAQRLRLWTGIGVSAVLVSSGVWMLARGIGRWPDGSGSTGMVIGGTMTMTFGFIPAGIGIALSQMVPRSLQRAEPRRPSDGFHPMSPGERWSAAYRRNVEVCREHGLEREPEGYACEDIAGLEEPTPSAGVQDVQFYGGPDGDGWSLGLGFRF